MKRHHSLIPLSHDHHSGLVLAQWLILGRSKAPRSDWPTDRRQQVSRVIEFFKTDLRQHFEAEEEHVFPAAVEHLREGADRTRTTSRLRCVQRVCRRLERVPLPPDPGLAVICLNHDDVLKTRVDGSGATDV